MAGLATSFQSVKNTSTLDRGARILVRDPDSVRDADSVKNTLISYSNTSVRSMHLIFK